MVSGGIPGYIDLGVVVGTAFKTDESTKGVSGGEEVTDRTCVRMDDLRPESYQERRREFSHDFCRADAVGVSGLLLECDFRLP